MRQSTDPYESPEITDDIEDKNVEDLTMRQSSDPYESPEVIDMDDKDVEDIAIETDPYEDAGAQDLPDEQDSEEKEDTEVPTESGEEESTPDVPEATGADEKETPLETKVLER